ncbi:energy transducer TonB [Psychrobium sp. MM17-31]|uniref:energy transducer TonB n=1 Tax=Psychrobium sp. MM17-31 TaxID=2917758 RepID=UPI001EF587ED|nr:energy transducer TonB [Psychrobium sp. MM17-31]MCG7530472.1 energy transducer TonB [Psychrobium sp. MM17-31]
MLRLIILLFTLGLISCQSTTTRITPSLDKLSEVVGREIAKAYDIFEQGSPKEAINYVKNIQPQKRYDKAYLNLLIGKLLLTQSALENAIPYLEKSFDARILEHSLHQVLIKDLTKLHLYLGHEKKADIYAKHYQDFNGKSFNEIKRELSKLSRKEVLQKLTSKNQVSNFLFRGNNRTVIKRVSPKLPHRVHTWAGPIEGYVVIQFDISSKGIPFNLQVIKSFPTQIYDKAALEAIGQWRYVVGNLEKGQTIRLDFTFEKSK